MSERYVRCDRLSVLYSRFWGRDGSDGEIIRRILSVGVGSVGCGRTGSGLGLGGLLSEEFMGVVSPFFGGSAERESRWKGICVTGGHGLKVGMRTRMKGMGWDGIECSEG